MQSELICSTLFRLKSLYFLNNTRKSEVFEMAAGTIIGSGLTEFFFRVEALIVFVRSEILFALFLFLLQLLFWAFLKGFHSPW